MIKPLVTMLRCYFQQNNVWINMFLISTITIILFFLFALRFLRATNPLPPSPPRFPLIGNLHQLGSLPHHSLQALSKKYGPIMIIHIGSVPTIVISSAQMASEVMKSHDLNFASRPRSSIAKMLLYDCDVAFSPYGEYWRQVRKICVVHLLSVKMVQSVRNVMEEEVSLMIGKIRSCQGKLVNLSELIVLLTNNIICRAAFGRKYYEGAEGASKLRHMLREFVSLLGSFPMGEYIPCLSWVDHLTGINKRARENFKELDDFLEGVLEEHLQAKTNGSNNHMKDGDFVDVLLSLDEKDESVGIPLGRETIKALILDMFAGGTETTFTMLEWAMAELIRNPRVMKRVQEEIRGVVGNKHKIEDNDICRMIYMKAIIKETLRLHPPFPMLVPRESLKYAEVGGFHIPRGTRVLVNGWAISRDPVSWDKPEEFVPDRFLNSNVDFQGHDFQFIPFGAGRRKCPGVSFATSSIESTLAHLLHHFDWDLPRGMEGEVLDMSESPGITVRKKSGLVLIAKPNVV